MNAEPAPPARIERLGLAAALVLAAALMWPVRGYLTDDTFIHLQYARHLAAGHGLVFNLGERVYGCTSPLWAALLAGGMALGLDGVAVARLLGALATLASVALFFQLTRRTLATPEWRALATLAWAGNAWMLRWSLSGMETPFAVMLVLAGFVTLVGRGGWGRRPLLTGTLWSLAALARPECALLLALWCAGLAFDALRERRWRRAWLGALPGVVLYGGWLLFARVYFGAAFPETLSAKTAGSGGAAAMLASLWRQARILGASDGALALVLATALVAGGARFRRPSSALEGLPWAWLVGLPVLYALRGVEVISRYLMVVLPVLEWLAWRSGEAWLGGAELGRRARRMIPALALAALALGPNLVLYRAAVLPQVRSFTAGLERSLVPWGRWFGAHTAADALIATPDIGAIGYFSGRRVLDLGGLVTPRMIPLLEREPLETAVEEFRFATFARPRYIVDRAPRALDLRRRSRYGACLTPLGTASVPNLGIARPGAVVYSFYRVDWEVFDRLRSSP